MRESNKVSLRGLTGLTFRSILVIAMIASPILFSGKADAQTVGTPRELPRQVPAPLPKVALNESLSELKGGLHYFRINLMITNWDRYPSEMFLVPVGRKLPPNPCAKVTSRVVIAVYSEIGASLSECIPMQKSEDLGKFSFYLRRGPVFPKFVYVVLNDRYTGGSYRSNLVSPTSGQTK